MTLQEAKNEIAKKYGYTAWDEVNFYDIDALRETIQKPYAEQMLIDEVAEFYAKQHKEDAEYWRKRYSSTQSMMDSYHRVGEDGWR